MKQQDSDEQPEVLPQAAVPRINQILRRLIPVVCIGVLGNLIFSWHMTDRGSLFSWADISFRYLFLAAVLALLPWAWHGARLSVWSRFFGIRISRLNLLRIVVATDVGGVMSPAVLGGTPFKMSMLIQQGFLPGQAAILTLLGQLEEALFFACAIPLSLALTQPWENPLWIRVGIFLNQHRQALLLGAAALAGLVFLLRKSAPVRSFFHLRFSRSEKWQLLAADFRSALKLVYTKGWKPFLLCMLIITGQWITRFAILLAVILALDVEADLFTIFFLQWMVFVAMLIVPTPGGTGTAETAFLLVYHALIPRVAVGSILAGWRLLTYYFMLLVGVGILFATSKKQDKYGV